MFRVNVSHLPILKPRGFDRQQMRQLGQYSIQLERERLTQALTVQDSPAKALDQKYARRKQRAGLAPVRNLIFTGNLLGSRSIIQSDGNMVQIGFSDARFYERAAVNEQIERMLGMSPANRRKLDALATRLLFQDRMAA